jgi:hypothetical protein
MYVLTVPLLLVLELAASVERRVHKRLSERRRGLPHSDWTAARGETGARTDEDADRNGTDLANAACEFVIRNFRVAACLILALGIAGMMLLLD